MSLTSKPVRPSLRYFMMAFLYEKVSFLGKMFRSRLTSISGSQDFRLVAPAPCRLSRGRLARRRSDHPGSFQPKTVARWFFDSSYPNFAPSGLALEVFNELRS